MKKHDARNFTQRTEKKWNNITGTWEFAFFDVEKSKKYWANKVWVEMITNTVVSALQTKKTF